MAEHGGWNRRRKGGYQAVPERRGSERASGREPFAKGWLDPDESITGRPVDLLQLPEGSLLSSDDAAGRIYCISYAAAATGR